MTGTTFDPSTPRPAAAAASGLSPDSVDRLLVWAFAPMHKRALGLAVGLTAAAIVFLLTTFHVLARTASDVPLVLLSQYFYGYELTWRGAAIGAWWAFLAGFVAGWFGAFMRNLVIGVWLMFVRMRANLSETRDFLDHI
jgi:hypothetical protein